MNEQLAIEEWEERFERLLRRELGSDSAHGLDHVRRVVGNAKRLGAEEGANMAVVVPAAWLHDCVTLEKDSRDRSRASRHAAAAATRHLETLGYPEDLHSAIAHAIEAHSFSAGIEPRTKEARVVQDADRLDALGAIGIARCFLVGGRLGRALYDEHDPFCRERQPDDARATIDHFFSKLLTLPPTMQTASGRREAERRARFLEVYLAELESEIQADLGG